MRHLLPLRLLLSLDADALFQLVLAALELVEVHQLRVGVDVPSGTARTGPEVLLVTDGDRAEQRSVREALVAHLFGFIRRG